MKIGDKVLLANGETHIIEFTNDSLKHVQLSNGFWYSKEGRYLSNLGNSIVDIIAVGDDVDITLRDYDMDQEALDEEYNNAMGRLA